MRSTQAMSNMEEEQAPILIVDECLVVMQKMIEA